MMTWFKLSLIVLAALCAIHGNHLVAQGGGGGGLGASEVNEYVLKISEDEVRSGEYKAWHRYLLAPGWAKPRRIALANGRMTMAMRTGQTTPVFTSATAGRGTSGMFIDAIVLERSAEARHGEVIVGLATRRSVGGEPGMEGGMAGGMSGYGGTGMGGDGGGMGMGMPGMGIGGMGGQGMSGDAMMGAVMGGGMGAGMGGGMGMSPGATLLLKGPIDVVPLDQLKWTAAGSPGSDSPSSYSKTQLKNLSELVKLDCWIEEELTELRATRKDGEKFKAAQNSLKDLLSQEYELQLSKQREDIQRLSEKLKALQGELERRSSAQERVVDVQLGQLVLEAQGLIGERP